METLQNYLIYTFGLLRREPDQEAGVLIHCISGWDRTPLFIGLLRILLWAEGCVHQSLNHEQILYLVVAYDWMLFGYGAVSYSDFFRHQFVSRRAEGCDIFYFAFWAISHLLGSDYSYSLREDSNDPLPQDSELLAPAPVEVKSQSRSSSSDDASGDQPQEELSPEEEPEGEDADNSSEELERAEDDHQDAARSITELSDFSVEAEAPTLPPAPPRASTRPRSMRTTPQFPALPFREDYSVGEDLRKKRDDRRKKLMDVYELFMRLYASYV